MVFIGDLLELKDRNLYLEIDGKKIPMGLHFYVADDIFFFQIDKDVKLHTLEELRNVLEIEAEDECWSGDIYEAPMQKISNCEIKFPKDFFNAVENDMFDDNYIITHIDTTTDDIIIHLA